MPAVPVMTVTKGKKKTKEGRRGRPRKTHFPLHPPVSRRSSLRTPRRQLREDFYNVDEIVVDDEDEEVQERGEVEEEMEEEEEEEEKFRSKKKLKLLLKLNQHHNHQIPTRPSNPVPVTKPRTVRRSGSSYFSEEEEGRSDGNRRCDGDNDEDEVDDDILHRDGGNIISRSPTSRKGTPLPDVKTLVLILDKIQKKDKYAVFRDPVDPEELPDYHDMIEHPMDFSTIRKKLARNIYSNLEQFESDIFLLCSNAMQYNAPETIYHKQASSMQELARKTFHNVRAGSKSCEISPNANKIVFSNMVKEKLIKDQVNSLPEKRTEEKRDTDSCKPKQKPMVNSPKLQAGSEISLAAEHAMNEIDGAELKNSRTITPDKLDNIAVSAANNAVSSEILPEKLDEPSERIISPSHGQKSTSFDEDRRATYVISTKQPPVEADSLFSILNSDKKLVALGLDEENSYARSLARFSASLGSSVWKIASGKIEKTIPAGLKFGPGWVGEYEAPIRPIFSSEDYLPQFSGKIEKSGYKTGFRDDRINYDDFRGKEASIFKNTHISTPLEFQSLEVYNRVPNAVEGPFVKRTVNGNQALFGVEVGNQLRIGSDTLNQQGEKISRYASNICSNNNEKAGIPTTAQSVINYRTDMTLQGNCLKSSEVVSQGSCATNGGGVNSFLAFPKENSGSIDMSHRYRSNMKFGLLNKEMNTSELATEKSIVKVEGLQTREDGTNSIAEKVNGSSVFKSTTPASIMKNSIPNGSMNQKIDDPTQLIKMLPGSLPNNPNSCYTTKQFIPPVLSPINHSGAALATTGYSWMPVSTSNGHEMTNASGSSEGQTRNPANNKPTWIFPNSMLGQNALPGFQEVDNRRTMSQFAPKPCQMAVNMQGVQNKSTVSFPQIFTTELPKFQLHSPWQGFVPVAQQRQSKSMCPPDLNIGFQSPGSPAQQSSGIHVDSQQPDLALQL